MIRHLKCQIGIHNWEVTAMRITHGERTCSVCGKSEWKQN